MGMAATQSRLLSLTNRNNDIKFDLIKLANQKLMLNREATAINREYRESLNSKTLKWSCNSGALTVDLSFDNLMTPSSLNSATPYLITNCADKVILDDKYAEYAKMLDDAGGKWEGATRANILSKLVGINASDIEKAETDYLNYWKYKNIADDAYANQSSSDWEENYIYYKTLAEKYINFYNELFTAEQENQINFYDALFSTVADKGWTCNNAVKDNDYLNNMLQNNVFTLTKVSCTFMQKEATGDWFHTNIYETDIASNCTKVVPVNDTDLQSRVKAKYELKKELINEKENRIDILMNKKQTSQSAIETEMKSLKEIIKNWTESTFNTTG